MFARPTIAIAKFRDYSQSMAAMLEVQNNKSSLHKNQTFFPMEENSIVFLLQHARCKHTQNVPRSCVLFPSRLFPNTFAVSEINSTPGTI